VITVDAASAGVVPALERREHERAAQRRDVLEVDHRGLLVVGAPPYGSVD
jgi:uncharacterized protein (DUF302 family)